VHDDPTRARAVASRRVPCERSLYEDSPAIPTPTEDFREQIATCCAEPGKVEARARLVPVIEPGDPAARAEAIRAPR